MGLLRGRLGRRMKACLLGVALAWAVGAQAAPPDIIVLMFDDLDALSFNEALSHGLLPNIQAHVVDRGTRFDESFVVESACCPSRSTYLSGLYPHNHGVMRNSGPKGGFKRFKDASTLATWLSGVGYRTGFIGKYLNGMKDASYVPPGWTEFWPVAGDEGDICMYNNLVFRNGGNAAFFGETEADYQTDVMARLAVEYLSAADSRPQFLSIMPYAPHLEGCLGHDTVRPAPRHAGTVELPLATATWPSFNEADVSDKPQWMRGLPLLDPTHERQVYNDRLAALRSVDDLMGRVVDTLKATGRYDRAALIVASDNGFQLGTHRLTGKVNLYEESIRVPLVIHAPGQTPGLRSPAWALNTDLAPTIAALAGTVPGAAVDGRSLTPLLDGTVPADWRRTLLVEFPFVGYVDGMEPTFLMVRSRDPALTQDATGQAVVLYSETYNDRTGALTDKEQYDLGRDPYQLNSLHEDTSSLRKRQRKALGTRMQTLATCKSGSCQALEN